MRNVVEHSLRWALLSVLVGLAATPTSAAVLEQVLVFLGKDEARLLLVFDGPPGGVEIRATPAVGSAPARTVLLLGNATVADLLLSSYRPRPGGAEMDVGQKGVRQIVFSQVGQGAQLAVELDQARIASLTPVDERTLLFDVRAPGSPADPSLPDAAALAAWVSGTAVAPANVRARGRQPRIVVDPGHGGWDTGAVGCTGTEEAEVALALARQVAAELVRALDAEVVLTREDDRYLTLHERAALANAQGADLFLSIHANAAPAPGVWGIETYYLDVASDERAAAVARRENEVQRPGGGPRDDAERVFGELVVSGTSALSARLAHEVQGSVIRQLTVLFGEAQIRDQGVKSAVFTVLVATRMPSILFEASFLTNPDEEMRLRTPAFQRATAEAVVAGVSAYLHASGGQP